MQLKRKWMALGVAAAVMLAAEPARAGDQSVLGDWPTHHVFQDGTDFGVSLLYQYDVNDFSHDDGKLQDAGTNRRKYLGLYLKKKGVYDAKVEFDYQGKKWQDAYLRLQSSAFIG